MKVGDILYFVDINLGKISKHKITTIGKCNSFANGDYDIIRFSNFKSYCYRVDLILNPAQDMFFGSHSIMRNNQRKSYLIFSKPEDAQQALVDYVLPRILEKHKKQSEELIQQFNKLVETAQGIEKQIEKEKKDFTKKCNALNKKIV